MAAVPEPFTRGLEITDIRNLGSRDLHPLLEEEAAEWDRELDWDFGKSAELIRKFADARGLAGAALMDRSSHWGTHGGTTAGYGYAIVEENKGLIGDVYVRQAWRGGDSEVRLFRTLLDSLIATPGVLRIESQLMLTEPRVAKALQRERFVRLFERLLLRFDCDRVLPRGRAIPSWRFRMEPWADHHYDGAATVISLAYTGHIDAQINDQYRTFDGARRFLNNVVQFPGCGSFFQPASFLALDIVTGWVAGISLCSFVSDYVGHITQLCVTPAARGSGLGYELLRRSVEELRRAGARRISLTVTRANTEAVRLYERCGFEELRRFYAYVWEER
jgi:ribosomal protein S18 acetylase RimI-like enzyme